MQSALYLTDFVHSVTGRSIESTHAKIGGYEYQTATGCESQISGGRPLGSLSSHFRKETKQLIHIDAQHY